MSVSKKLSYNINIATLVSSFFSILKLILAKAYVNNCKESDIYCATLLLLIMTSSLVGLTTTGGRDFFDLVKAIGESKSKQEEVIIHLVCAWIHSLIYLTLYTYARNIYTY